MTRSTHPSIPRAARSLVVGILLVCLAVVLPQGALGAPVVAKPKAIDPTVLGGLDVVSPSALASASKTKAEGSNGGSPEFREWGREVFVAFTDKEPRQFRLRTTEPGAKAIRWELGRSSITSGGTIVASGKTTVKTAGGWHLVEVPFGPLAPAPQVQGAGTAGAAAAKSGALAPKTSGPSAKPAGATMTKSPAIGPTSKSGMTATSTPTSLATLPRVYWLRAVALDAAGKAIGLPSPAVKVVHGIASKKEEADIFIAPQPAGKSDGGLTMKLMRYEPVHMASSGAYTRWVVTGPNILGWPVGHKFVLDKSKTKDKDLLSAVGGAIEDVVGLAIDAIDWASEAYADIKAFAVKVAAGLVPGCTALPACKSVIAGALDAGLASVGLPPSLPDFDALVDMGEGYLVEVIAEEIAAQLPAGALTAELAEDGTRALVKEARKRIADASAHGPDGKHWYKPDPDYQWHDAYVVLEVKNTGKTTERGGSIVVAADGLYSTMYVPVPKLKPGQSMTIPVSLTPDIDYYERKWLRTHGGASTSESMYWQGWHEAFAERDVYFVFGGSVHETFHTKASERWTR